jgi:hypothetical protein
VKIQVKVFWIVMLWSIAVGYQHFGRRCCLHLFRMKFPYQQGLDVACGTTSSMPHHSCTHHHQSLFCVGKDWPPHCLFSTCSSHQLAPLLTLVSVSFSASYWLPNSVPLLYSIPTSVFPFSAWKCRQQSLFCWHPTATLHSITAHKSSTQRLQFSPSSHHSTAAPLS